MYGVFDRHSVTTFVIFYVLTIVSSLKYQFFFNLTHPCMGFSVSYIRLRDLDLVAYLDHAGFSGRVVFFSFHWRLLSGLF